MSNVINDLQSLFNVYGNPFNIIIEDIGPAIQENLDSYNEAPDSIEDFIEFYDSMRSDANRFFEAAYLFEAVVATMKEKLYGKDGSTRCFEIKTILRNLPDHSLIDVLSYVTKLAENEN